jgi:hypothetical protein
MCVHVSASRGVLVWQLIPLWHPLSMKGASRKVSRQQRALQYVVEDEMSRLSLTSACENAENVDPLLRNFQEIFNLQGSFIAELDDCLHDLRKNVAILFVDLDNYPQFFNYVTPGLLQSIDFDMFIICSANRACSAAALRFPNRVHFTLAMPSKDAADAVCTVAMAKLDSILVHLGRQDDVTLMMISNDKIFAQVRFLSPVFMKPVGKNSCI